MYVIPNFFGKVVTVKAGSTLINSSVAHQHCRYFKNQLYAQHKKQPQPQHLKSGTLKSMQLGKIKKGFNLMKPFTGLVIRIGFKPMTCCLEGSCSIQLSYRTSI